MGVIIGGDYAKSGKNSHLLVIMRVKLSQKIGLLDLTNRTRFKKGNGQKQCTKTVRDYCGIRFMLHTPSYYYAYTNVDLLGVWRREMPKHPSSFATYILCRNPLPKICSKHS